MATTITGKLNKDANQFAAGEYTGFGLRLGKQYYDRETKQKEWTNYEFVLFAKAQGQIDFYTSALVEGAVIEVSAPEEKVKVFEGQNGPVYSIELIDAKLGYVFSPSASAGQQQPRQQPAQQPQRQRQAPSQPQGGDPFGEDIPFNSYMRELTC